MSEFLHELDLAASWVARYSFNRIALQLGDADLAHSSQTIDTFKSLLTSHGVDTSKALVFALADSSYNPLEVDEVAAAHLGAQCVVHIGRASLSPVSTLPSFMIFGERSLDLAAVSHELDRILTPASATPRPVIFLDQAYLHLRTFVASGREVDVAEASARELFPAGFRRAPPEATSACCEETASDRCGKEAAECCSSTQPAATSSPAESQGIAGYVWPGWGSALTNPDETATRRFLWIGPLDAPALRELQMITQTARWTALEPTAEGAVAVMEGLVPETQRLLKRKESVAFFGLDAGPLSLLARRYFLLEKARCASILGILVGTLGVAGFGAAVRRLRALAEAAGKKTYTVVVGKPNPAKLANFPEVEVWVHVASGQGVLLDSKEYLAPIVTVFEAELALRDMDWPTQYRMGLDAVAGEGSARGAEDSPRFSLLTGAALPSTSSRREDRVGGGAADSQLAVATDRALKLREEGGAGNGTVTVLSAAEYLVARRTFQGLETPAATGAEKLAPQMAVEGMSGRAAAYQGEGNNLII